MTNALARRPNARTALILALAPGILAAAPATAHLGQPDMVRGAPRPLQQHDGLRCGDRLVELGERTAEVLAKCGAPLTRDRWTETRTHDGKILLVNVEEWVYSADDGSFRRLLRFENGRLRSIEALRR